MPHPMVADIHLARRLERAEGYACAMSVESRLRKYPASAAQWIEIAGTYAMYDAVGSPLNQTFGLGLFEQPTPEHMDKLEFFFRDRRQPVHHETSPAAGMELLNLLTGRGYRPIEYTSIMYRELADIGEPPNTAVKTRLARPDEVDTWARLVTRGWSDSSELGETIYELCRTSADAPGRVLFLAELEGTPISGGVLCIHGGVGLLGGSSTVPEYRQRGAHAALLHARMRYAAEAGCDVAMISAAPPAGGSQRNAERVGFRMAYTRVKFALD